QDLNGDGVFGPIITAIEGSGQSRLFDVADAYFLYAGSGSPVALKVGGAMVAEGQLGAWQPIAAEQAGVGYQVAWKLAGNIWIWKAEGRREGEKKGAFGNGDQCEKKVGESRVGQGVNRKGGFGANRSSSRGS